MPPDEGYEPPTPELNQEEGVLDITHVAECTLVEESKMVAETIVLRCSLRPIPLQNKAIYVQLIAEGEALEQAPLYQEDAIAYGYEGESADSCWQGIALEYTGIGRGLHNGESFVFYDTTLPFGKIEVPKPLYIKPFSCELANYQERLTSLPSGMVLRSPPGVLDTQILRGYGGYYKQGIVLQDISQVYYSLTSTHRQTKARLVNSSSLYEQHTPPPHGGKAFDYKVQFNPLSEEEYLSLPGALAAGYGRIVVTSDIGTTVFTSFLCESVPGFPNEVNVYYSPFRHGWAGNVSVFTAVAPERSITIKDI
ncbi:MAG: hypothetical protein H0X26_02000 [Alphaproteobacteria bacterium]|nr:hypothetical protein [Alphaproteobacteria bacterium]